MARSIDRANSVPSTPARHLLDQLRIMKFRFPDLVFGPCWHVCVGFFFFFFLTTLDIYKAYFRSHHIREYKENICKKWTMPYSLWKKLLCLCALGFCNQVLIDLHCWWSEEVCSQHSSSLSWWMSHILGSVQQKWWRSYIEEFRGSEAIKGFYC